LIKEYLLESLSLASWWQKLKTMIFLLKFQFCVSKVIKTLFHFILPILIPSFFQIASESFAMPFRDHYAFWRMYPAHLGDLKCHQGSL